MDSPYMLDSTECTLIMALEETKTLQELSQALKRDPSVLSRQINKIVEKYPLAEKISGRWTLTPLGRRIAEWTRRTSFEQSELLNARTHVRIGSTREFSARILAPQLQNIQKDFPRSFFSIESFERGVEDNLLNGQVDIALDCGRPNEPNISFKRITPEPMVIVAQKKFWEKNKVKSKNDLITLPYYRYARMNFEKVLELSQNLENPKCLFNDIASMREALLCDEEVWSLFPRYTVLRELENKSLSVSSLKIKSQESFGVWSLRSRSDLKNIVLYFETWLKRQNL